MSVTSVTVRLTKPNRNAEDLTAAEWNKVLRINKALYGFTIREAPEMDVVNARYPGNFTHQSKHHTLALIPAQPSL